MCAAATFSRVSSAVQKMPALGLPTAGTTRRVNDLTPIENEIDKLSVNLGKRTSITEDDIEKYIGVSKDFNVFELQAALAAKDLSRSIRIIQYFEANPKAALQLVLPSLYSFFSKVFMVFGTNLKMKEQ